MADITLCGNPDRCPVKQTCKRFTTKATELQAYMIFYQSRKECAFYLRGA